MASQRYTDLKKLFEDSMPEGGLLKDRYTRLGKAMVDELNIPTNWESYAACDELVGGTKRTALGIPPVLVLLESKGIDSSNRLDMGKRQLKRLVATPMRRSTPRSASCSSPSPAASASSGC